jgi:hypothetical protein
MWRWSSGVPDPHESVVTVDFEDVGGRTKIVLVHGGFNDESPTDPYESGWVSGLDKTRDLPRGIQRHDNRRTECLTLSIG